MTLSAMSQQDYPRLTLIDGDTIALFNSQQLKKINLVLLEREKYVLLYENVSEELLLWKSKDSISKGQIDLLNEKLGVKRSIIEEKQTQYDACNESLDLCGKHLRKTKLQKFLYLGGGAIVGCFIGLLIK